FQIIEGITKDQILSQKNEYGYAIARARKIGKWNIAKEKIDFVSWMPLINSPVFLKNICEENLPLKAIGRLPNTNYYACIDNIDELVTHNTAIIGILGIGKTMLSLELIERLINHGVRVICIDLTDEYKEE